MCLLQVNYYFYRVVYAFIIYIYLFIYCSLAVCVRCSSPVDANSLQFELCWNIAYIHTLKLWQSISECCKFVESSCIQICKHFLSHLSDSRMSSDRGTFFKSVFQPIANWFICPGFGHAFEKPTKIDFSWNASGSWAFAQIFGLGCSTGLRQMGAKFNFMANQVCLAHCTNISFWHTSISVN